MKLNLETLKQVKFTFDIHSDHSTRCNGYRSLCRMIEEAEKEVNENFVQPDVSGQSEQFYCVSSDSLVHGKSCEKWCGNPHCKDLVKQ